MANRQIEQMDGGEDIAFGIEDGFSHRPSNVNLGGVVINNLGLLFMKNLFQRLPVTEVGLIESHPGREILPRAARKIIHHRHIKTLRTVSIHNMGADEPRSARHKNFHPLLSSSIGRLEAPRVFLQLSRLPMKPAHFVTRPVVRGGTTVGKKWSTTARLIPPTLIRFTCLGLSLILSIR